MRAILLGSDPVSITSASVLVARGGLIAFPTDTVYGLGCDPTNRASVERLIGVKERDSKPIPVLCSSEEAAMALVELSPTAVALARAHWPGALTIVAPLKVSVPKALDQGTGWLGVRVPDDEIALSLARACGGTITGTSANLSGRPSSRSAEEVAESLGELVDAIIDGGERRGRESTVVRVNGEAVEVLRRGAVAIEPGITRESLDR